ncbi:acylphosphatase [Halodesulfovibrio sp.]|jgi:acylphosphatase|uniref:acylphosphatase n=1 Tax=Halodesulfovibrio sp. TaxID=1912772 RepID=UPI0025F49116|nr:acylphosphatase [Halodesulfovibrio sp.]MCT4536172.1 acylphosphatase [Halodesulfovibrio sp.]MCT4626816.1 acylphosphatase [Halodesulfovibrio sp.]
MARQRYIISGKVQGVGFRYWAHHTAISLGLSGWVRNLPDGRVELVAEGDISSLRQFEKELWQGPVSGHVTDVQPCDTNLQEELTGFSMH